jgi:hypothetical protein
MLGVPNPRGVRLYASRDLPQAEFDQAVVSYETVWQLGAQMRNMLVIDKPTYPEAIARLFEIWNARERDELEQARRELPGLPSLHGDAPRALEA